MPLTRDSRIRFCLTLGHSASQVYPGPYPGHVLGYSIDRIRPEQFGHRGLITNAMHAVFKPKQSQKRLGPHCLVNWLLDGAFDTNDSIKSLRKRG